MNTKGLFLSIAILCSACGIFAQQPTLAQPIPITSDDAVLSNTPRVTLPISYATRPLPAKKDNTRIIFFSGIYNQYVWNCNQASSIWTMFTYEINYLRNLDSSVKDYQYSPMAIYNHLNYGNGSQGVSYFDSWNLIKTNGIPASPDYATDNQNWQAWMTGYDKYYRGMKNRIDQVYAIDVRNPEGLLTLKHWINDHLDGSQVGGLANFQIGSGDMVIPTIPVGQGLEEEGQYIVIKYGPYVGHAMTFAGWNDSIRYDVNGDGRYTNNIDINGDGVVNMKDWENGAMLVVNSWGAAYNNGKLWVMYRLLAEEVKDGGIWNNAAMVVKPKKTYEPLLTVKAKVRYNQRNRLKIQVGVSSDPNATVPEKVMDFPCFNYQGDVLPMQGFVDLNSDLLEFGLDITPLMNEIPQNGKARIFLEVVQKSPDDIAAGRIESFSVMDYTHGVKEFTNTDGMVAIARNTLTRLSVPIATTVIRPEIITEELPDASVGQNYRAQLEADGTTAPYRYANPETWFVETPVAETIALTGGTNILTTPGSQSEVVNLPFEFPFYGINYDKVTVLSDGGVVMGDKVVIYPYIIDSCLRFYQNKGIFPFFGHLWYRGTNDKITFEASVDAAIIRWHATLDPEGNLPLNFAAKILPDGGIRFFYGNMTTSPDRDWISGLSAGNNLDFHLMGQNISGVKANTAFSLNLLDWPSWLSLGSNGDLKGTPAHSGTYTLPFKVTDWTGISNYKELTLKVSGGSSVVNESLEPAIKLFPNPATDAIWLQGFTNQPGSLSLTLYNLTGSQVFTRQFNVPSGKILIPISETSTLPSGIYLFKINGIITETGKLIRQ